MYLAMRRFPLSMRGHTRKDRFGRRYAGLCVGMVAFLSISAVAAKTKVKTVPPVNRAIEVTAWLADPGKAVEEVAEDPVVYGTYVYERDKTLTGAHEADSSPGSASAFGKEVLEGKVL